MNQAKEARESIQPKLSFFCNDYGTLFEIETTNTGSNPVTILSAGLFCGLGKKREEIPSEENNIIEMKGKTLLSGEKIRVEYVILDYLLMLGYEEEMELDFVAIDHMGKEHSLKIPVDLPKLLYLSEYTREDINQLKQQYWKSISMGKNLEQRYLEHLQDRQDALQGK
ncbi:hypothetical protein [Risungbinella massiliensis]|uniref:hypothetical protein n=1 Tax=Risungbinella massiliensis TaxID=1329796 RepID=UPI0005CC8618|nr:hypothetical protein [Risungbinella massiliensis]